MYNMYTHIYNTIFAEKYYRMEKYGILDCKINQYFDDRFLIYGFKENWQVLQSGFLLIHIENESTLPKYL